MKIIFLLLLFLTLGFGRDITVIAHNNFPKDHLNAKMIKAIFLDKKRFIADKKLLPINYPFDDVLRECFERSILKKSRYSLESYWRSAHYKGKSPPKVVKSKEMLFKYIENVDMAIGYIDTKSLQDTNFKILYKGHCP